MGDKLSRREFVRNTAMVTGAAVVAPHALAARQSPNETLGVAVIGAGGMGGYAVDVGLGERVIAFCDIDDNALAGAMKKAKERRPELPEPKGYYDYRKMLDECKKDIDVVLISTPDHHHAPAAIRAIQMGKHVFCQKPLAYNIYECRALARAAQRYKVKTQMGNQGHTGEAIRRACEYLWDGCIGNVTETHSILGRNFGGNGGRPESKPVPPNVHWDEWIGPAPFREYHDGLHPFSWRSWRQFGTGTIGDMACHNLDVLFWALKVKEAKKITLECLNTTPGSEEQFNTDNVVRYDIPARAGMPPLKVYVYDHQGLKPEVMKETEKECEIKFSECTLFLGDKGKFWTTGTAGQARILPLEKHAEYPAPPVSLPRAHGGPIEDLFWAIKNNGTPCSNIPEWSGPLTEFALLGHLAQKAGVGQKVEWDVQAMRCTNMPQLNELVRRKYRNGWAV
ncbi:MAG: Gfo/Idh/MocA family oxidoreductase [Chthonomonadales bacterium]|nr:Gfo/Idh/MocA family oxidoreductase [Chthonomonadales bacterium]